MGLKSRTVERKMEHEKETNGLHGVYKDSVPQYLTVLWARDITRIVENHMGKDMEHQMEIGFSLCKRNQVRTGS